MTELRELFEEAVNSAPPSRLLADEVYAAGRRHRRRRRWAIANGAAAVVIAVAAGTGIAASVAEGPTVTGETGSNQQQPSPGVLPHSGEQVQSVRAADARHLYLTMSTRLNCSKERCAKSVLQLVGSDDGGRTWTDRGGPINTAGVEVLGPDRLLAIIVSDTTDAGARTLQTSTDGGRSWRPLDRAPAVAAVATGSRAVCWRDSGQVTSPCTVYAIDPVSHRIAPLVTQPPLRLEDDLLLGESSGRLWASGVDPAGRPAAAVSHDAGRTWSTTVFADPPACSPEGCVAQDLAVGDGPTGYAVIVGTQSRAVYRYVENNGQDGGDWQRVPGADSVPADRLTSGRQSFVTSDGAHVLLQVVAMPGQDLDGYRYWAARPGGAYQPAELDGLPATSYPVRRTQDGWFYAHDYTDGALYGSTDGRHWSSVARSS
ncbi:sialidase family protein [Micromonospora sp. CPCC 205539]|uniref:sialidase family protein n=1 Tax=Micromonospora sp. CPCC 205539 TaxID=3122408 RepID=UPI002FF01329